MFQYTFSFIEPNLFYSLIYRKLPTHFLSSLSETIHFRRNNIRSIFSRMGYLDIFAASFSNERRIRVKNHTNSSAKWDKRFASQA